MMQSLSNFLQWLPRFRGKRRASNFFLKVTRLNRRKNLEITTRSGRFLLPNLVEIISFDLFINGDYESGLVQYLKAAIPQGGIFVDVGANIGSISIPLALARPDVRIVAIEASPWIYRILSKNIELNGLSNIDAINNAAYFDSGKAIKIYAPQELFGKGSLNPIYTKDGETVTTITIDDVKLNFSLKSIDVLKVDVEGFEILVFQGMEKTIRDHRPRIIFEFADWTESKAGFEPGAAQSFLIDRGYELTKMSNSFIPESSKMNQVMKADTANLLAC